MPHSHPGTQNHTASLTRRHPVPTPPRIPGPATRVTWSNPEHNLLWAIGEWGLCGPEQLVPAPPRLPGHPCWGDPEQPTPTSPQPRGMTQSNAAHTSLRTTGELGLCDPGQPMPAPPRSPGQSCRDHPEQPNVHLIRSDRRVRIEHHRLTRPQSTLRRGELEQDSKCLTLGYKKVRTE